MLVSNKQFLILDQNCFSTLSWQTVFQNKRVLVCSITRHPQIFLQKYINDLKIYSELYKLFGVDDVYLITSTELAVIKLTHQAQNLRVIGDPNSEFTSYLDSITNKSNKDPLFLRHYWNYQVLINNGKIEHLTQQPIDQYFKHLLQKSKNNLELIRFIGDERLIWTPTFLSRSSELSRRVYYYNLHPNIELKKYLFSNFQANR